MFITYSYWFKSSKLHKYKFFSTHTYKDATSTFLKSTWYGGSTGGKVLHAEEKITIEEEVICNEVWELNSARSLNYMLSLFPLL